MKEGKEKGNVVKLVEHAEEAQHWGVSDMLTSELERIESGERECNKALVLFLNEGGDMYNVGYGNAGLSDADMIALIEIFKGHLLRDMGV